MAGKAGRAQTAADILTDGMSDQRCDESRQTSERCVIKRPHTAAGSSAL